MADISFFKKIVDDIKKRTLQHGMVSAHTILRPIRDWKIILVIFTVLNITTILFDTYLFLEINKGEIFLVEPAQPQRIDAVDTEALREVLTVFEEKAQNFEELKRQTPTFADPSL